MRNQFIRRQDREFRRQGRARPALGFGALASTALFMLLRSRMRGRFGNLGTTTVADIMTENPVSVGREASIRDVARLMIQCDCGEIPIVDRDGKPIGVVTDRDVVARLIAQGIDPFVARVERAMTSPARSVRMRSSLDEAARLMERHQIRRLPVVDDQGRLRGIVSIGDIARLGNGHRAGEVMGRVSSPSHRASRFAA